MGEMENLTILRNEKINKKVYEYLKSLFENLDIEILNKDKNKLFELMKAGKLEKWCWQTTETACLFMPDDSILIRGHIFLDNYKVCQHSFIVFNFEKSYYVFDPALNLVNSIGLYLNTLNVIRSGKVLARDVKNYFIDYINNPPSDELFNLYRKFMKKIFGDNFGNKKEIVLHGNEDPNAPIYKNGSGYRDVKIEDDNVKRLTVHFYSCE